ncbi:MAG TPA: TlpA disulfide reductase family protein [Ardenticatenaceae bacterium]|nr:TlpA disulfide reductase family protein [Ardenticatenaceae bacterium]
MKPFRRLISALLLLLLSACARQGTVPVSGDAAQQLATAQALAPAPRTGRLAPDFTAPGIQGAEEIHLGMLRGRPVVLNFWATWCEPCRAELPELEAVYREHGGELAVVGVQIEDDDGDATAFLEEAGVSFPVARDLDGGVQALYLERVALPTSFFIDRDGLIRHVQVGPMNKAFIEERLRELAG